MGKISSKTFTNSIYRLFQVIFYIQLLIVCFLVLFNYFSYDSDQGLRFTVRGEIFGLEKPIEGNGSKIGLESIGGDKNPIITKNKYGVATYSSEGKQTIFYFNQIRKGFLRIDYSDFFQAFSLKNLSWFLLEIFNLLIGLFITFQLMKFIQSLRYNSAFTLENIKRLKLLGISFIVIPLTKIASDALLFSIANVHLNLSNIKLFPNFSWLDFLPYLMFKSSALGINNHTLFPSIALGLVVLLIAQIFKKGLEIQTENKLTI